MKSKSGTVSVSLPRGIGFSVGGIAIFIECPDDVRRFAERSYPAFKTDSTPDISLKLRYVKFGLEDIVSGRQVFDAGGRWRLHMDRGRRIFSFYSVESGTVPTKVAVISEDLSSGEIFLDETADPDTNPLEYPLDEVLAISLLGSGRGIMAHACGACYERGGVLFAGVSGSGKSTIGKILMKARNASILNDDRTIIRRHGADFFIYGTPWHGEIEACSPDRAFLKNIFFIKHSGQNDIRRLRPSEAALRLAGSSFMPFWDADGVAFTLGFLSELAEKVPAYELGFVPDPSVAEFLEKVPA